MFVTSIKYATTASMNNENPPASNHEHEAETAPQDVYYISETGSLWRPMIVVVQIRDLEGRITKYMLGDPKDPAKTIEVSAAWFDQNKDDLRIPEDRNWSAAGKPTLETPVSSETPQQHELPDEQIKLATVAIGSAEAPQEDSKAEVVRLESQLRDIYESLSDSDKRAVWQYAASVSDEERALKVPYISEDIRQSGLHLKYRGLFDQLRAARKRAEKA
jgi:hypothetical protein